MKWKLSLITLICVLSNVISEPAVSSPCPKEEPTCLTKLIRVLYKEIVSGNQALNIPPSDPLYQELIEGYLSTGHYTLTKSTLIGFSQCEIETVRITEDRNGTIFEFFCPHFKLTGHYVMDGELIVVPIKGDGEFCIKSDEYYITVKADIKLLYGSNGRRFLYFKNLEIVEADLKGGMDMDLDNLFEGDKESAETARNFIHDNWKQVADLIQMPIGTASFTKLFANLNRVMQTVPVDNMYKDEN